MKYLKKTWVRAIVSFFAAGISMEIVWLATANDPNTKRPSSMTLGVIVLAVVVYLGITKVLNRK